MNEIEVQKVEDVEQNNKKLKWEKFKSGFKKGLLIAGFGATAVICERFGFKLGAGTTALWFEQQKPGIMDECVQIYNEKNKETKED